MIVKIDIFFYEKQFHQCVKCENVQFSAKIYEAFNITRLHISNIFSLVTETHNERHIGKTLISLKIFIIVLFLMTAVVRDFIFRHHKLLSPLFLNKAHHPNCRGEKSTCHLRLYLLEIFWYKIIAE